MSGNEEIKQKVLEWFNSHSREGSKTKFYLRDDVRALTDYEKRDVQNLSRPHRDPLRQTPL